MLRSAPCAPATSLHSYAAWLCWQVHPTTAASECSFHRLRTTTGASNSWRSPPCRRRGASRPPRSADPRPTARGCWGPRSRGRPDPAPARPPPVSASESCRTVSTTCWRDREDGRSSTMPSCECPSTFSFFWKVWQTSHLLCALSMWYISPINAAESLRLQLAGSDAIHHLNMGSSVQFPIFSVSLTHRDDLGYYIHLSESTTYFEPHVADGKPSSLGVKHVVLEYFFYSKCCIFFKERG